MMEPVHPTTILVPTDFSPGADVALGWAQSLGRAFSAEVILLHVVDLSIAALAGFPSTLAAVPAAGELLDRIRAETEEAMGRLTARVAGARGMVREGMPRQAILEVAREVGAHLIVMGTHGRTGLTHVVFGSVAEHVVRHSRIPVLTVRQQG
jgi:nucleotide-binding universal stress UspA family protein